MPSDRLVELVQDFHREEPASAEAIDQLVKTVGFPLPADYLEFLKMSNGAVPPDSDLQQLYSVEDMLLIWRGNEYEYADAGLLMFGTTGGGQGFCFARHGDRTVIVLVEMEQVGGPDDWGYYGDSFEEFLETIAAEDAAHENDEDPPVRPRLSSL